MIPIFQNNIFKQSQRLEELKSQMNWDQQTLEAWLEESLRKEEDAQIVQKYTQYDEAKVKVGVECFMYTEQRIGYFLHHL